MSDEKCMWCKNNPTHYCDASIGFGAVGAIRDEQGNVTGLLTGAGGGMWTCDAPMCADHTHLVGVISGAESGTIDYCPYHWSNLKKEIGIPVMFENEVEAKRRDIFAQIRRSNFLIKQHS